MVLKPNEACPRCGRFANRGISVDAVIIRDDQVLLVQRGVEPDKGFWATPGGYIEWDESAEDAVRREIKEETALDAMSLKLVNVSSDPARHPKQVINLVYLVEVVDGVPAEGDDAMDVKWFSLKELPSQMALDHKKNIDSALKVYS